MKGDIKIKNNIIEIKKKCDEFITNVSSFSFDAYSDRILEEIFKMAKETEKIHVKRFKNV